MSHERPEPQEVIGYRRAPTLPGIAVLDAHHSPRDWRCVNESFALSFLGTWRGTNHEASLSVTSASRDGVASVDRSDWRVH